MKTTKAQRHQVRVILDVTPLAGDRPTGIGHYARHLLEELAEIDDLVIEGRWRPGGSRRRIHLDAQLPKTIVARRWLPVVSDLDLRGFDIYHGTDSRIPERGRFVKIVTVHDLAVYEPDLLEPGFARQGRERFESMLTRCRPDRILAISAFTRDRLVERFPHLEPITRVVPLGVTLSGPPSRRERGLGGVSRRGTEDAKMRGSEDANHISSLIPSEVRGAEYGVRNESNPIHTSSLIPHPFLLAPGTVERRKNQVATIHAFEIIKRSFPDLKLVVAGGDGFDSHIAAEAIERSPVRESINRRGYVSDDELAELYRSAVATLYPSLYEGFGLPILEAMAAGSPVITSDRGAMLETSGDAALHADPTDPESIAEATIRLLEDASIRASLVHAGLDRAAYFTWKRCAEGTAELYRQCVRG